jgi:nucleotide-binding universal stress UspA family protein
VDKKAQRMETSGGKVKDAHLAFGKPDEEIVKLGDELEAGLIVTRSLGLSSLRHARIQRVSQ